jgi:hypothetical protein
MTTYDIDDIDDDDPKRVLRDGQRMRVRLKAMDDAERVRAAQDHAVRAAVDALAAAERSLLDAERKRADAVADAYSSYEDDLCSAWKTPEQRTEDAVRDTMPRSPGFDARESAYKKYEKDLVNAWKAA